MTLSVIIPTKNRAAQLSRTLQSLTSQSIPRHSFEVIVVDNGSSDRTREAAQGYAGEFAHWKLVQEPKRGAAAARNRGLAASQGDIVAFLDDDVIPDAHLLEEHLATHRQQPGVAVLGSVRFPWTGNESGLHWLLTRRPELLQSFRFSDSSNVPFLHFYTCNLSLPRSFFSRAAPFDEAFAGYGFEDIELGFRWVRSGGRIVFNPRASALHDLVLSYALFAEKRHRAGNALRYLLEKHPELESLFLPPQGAGRWKLSSLMGFLSAPLAPLFDRRIGFLAPLVLPLVGRLCGFHLAYRFWAGFAGGSRASDVPAH